MPGEKMIRTERMVSERGRTAGDAAVEGLLAGVGAGIAMAAWLVLAGLLAGEGPGRVLARFDPAVAAAPVTGAMIHLGVSAVYGLLFGVLHRLIGRGRLTGQPAGVLLGLAYGLALLFVAQRLTLTGAGAPLREIPALHLAAAHLVYGVVLGWLVARR